MSYKAVVDSESLDSTRWCTEIIPTQFLTWAQQCIGLGFLIFCLLLMFNYNFHSFFLFMLWISFRSFQLSQLYVVCLDILMIPGPGRQRRERGVCVVGWGRVGGRGGGIPCVNYRFKHLKNLNLTHIYTVIH